MQYGGITGRSQPRQTIEDPTNPASAAVIDAAADDDDNDDDDDANDDPFDIPEGTDDLAGLGLAMASSPGRKPADVEKQTAGLELESMSSERKEKLGRGRRDGSVEGQTTPSSRSGSGRRKVRSCLNDVIRVS